MARWGAGTGFRGRSRCANTGCRGCRCCPSRGSRCRHDGRTPRDASPSPGSFGPGGAVADGDLPGHRPVPTDRLHMPAPFQLRGRRGNPQAGRRGGDPARPGPSRGHPASSCTASVMVSHLASVLVSVVGTASSGVCSDRRVRLARSAGGAVGVGSGVTVAGGSASSGSGDERSGREPQGGAWAAQATQASTSSRVGRFGGRPSPDERPVRRRPIHGSTYSR